MTAYPMESSSKNSPKEYKIPSREYPITVNDACQVLIEAIEVKANKPLYKAAIAKLKKKQKTIDKVT